MKRSVLSLAAAGAMMAATAQNQSWTAVDINGQTHDIQAYLNAGKTVLVDISAHWCGPCWAWHNSGIMEQLYFEHGPNGTNDLMIIFVDGDPASSMALLEGAQGSQGDWTVGTPYPIIGPNGVGNGLANIYNISAYPTLFMHCPGSNAGVEIDREATYAQFLNSWRTQCPTPYTNGVNDATIYGDHHIKEVCPGDPVSVELVNCGSANMTSATITAKQGATLLQTVNWTGSLAPYAISDVEFDQINVTNYMDVTFEVSSPNGQADANSAGNQELEGIMPAPLASTALTLELKTDNYGEETTWKLFDSNGAVVQQDPAGDYADNATFTYDWTLNAGECYRFEIYDAYGDGICCSYGNGYYRLKKTGTNTIFIDGGAFGGEETRPFAANVAATVEEVASTETVSIYPNPSNGLVNLAFNTTENLVNVEVFNVIGARVMTRTLSNNGVQTIDMSGLNNGIYYFSINIAGNSTTHKVTLNR